MIRRLETDVPGELPEIEDVIVPFTIPMGEYNKAQNDFLSWLRTKSKERAKRAAKAQELVKIGYLKRLVAEEKLPQVIAWIKSYLEETDDKLVLYATHTMIVRGIFKQFQSIAVCCDGKTPAKQKKTIEKRFQTDKRIRLFIGQTVAAGTGYTLTAAPCLAFVELPTVPGVLNQIKKRVHRITQKRAVKIVYLLARNTIEEHMCRIVQSRQKVVSNVLDGHAIKNTITVHDELIKSLQKGILNG